VKGLEEVSLNILETSGSWSYGPGGVGGLAAKGDCLACPSLVAPVQNVVEQSTESCWTLYEYYYIVEGHATPECSVGAIQNT
jgi:hypothetical protein